MWEEKETLISNMGKSISTYETSLWSNDFEEMPYFQYILIQDSWGNYSFVTRRGRNSVSSLATNDQIPFDDLHSWRFVISEVQL